MKAMVALVAVFLLAGCADDETSGDDDLETPGVDGGPATTMFEGSIQASIATPHMSFNQGGAFSTELPRGVNTTGWVIEMVWTPEAPTNDELSLWIRDADAGNVQDPNSLITPTGPLVRADGPSPLRLVVLAEEVPDEPHTVLARAPDDQGVVANQPFTLYITTFDLVDVDPEFTAIA